MVAVLLFDKEIKASEKLISCQLFNRLNRERNNYI